MIPALLLAVLLGAGCYGLVQTLRLQAPPPAIEPDMLGMVVRDPWYDFGTYPGQPNEPNYAAQDRMGELLAQMGVRWVRIEFHIEGSDELSATHVARNDYFIREVAPRHGFRVLGLLSFGLLRDQDVRLLGMPSSTSDPVYGAGINAAQRTWLNRARMIANRYQGDVHAYEIMNEPNRFSASGDEALPPEAVARLHTTFYTFFRHIDRLAVSDERWRDDVKLILGGPQPAGTGQRVDTSYLSDREYLYRIYTSPAFRGYYAERERFPLDGLGYHPYPQEISRSLHRDATPHGDSPPLTQTLAADADPAVVPTRPQLYLELMLTRLDGMRGLLEAVGDPDVPFWITEIGYNVGYPDHDDEADMAEFLRLTFTHLAAREDVARVFWFKYEDFPPRVGPRAQRWGSVVVPFVQDSACPGGACYHPDGYPLRLRPAFWAFRELAGRAEATPEPPAELHLTGPAIGAVGEQLTFTAVLSRSTATLPLRFVWRADVQAEVARNRSERHDTLALTWQQPGTYRVALEAHNPAGTIIANHTVLVAAPTPTPRPTETVPLSDTLTDVVTEPLTGTAHPAGR
jgi:hypothetical protein